MGFLHIMKRGGDEYREYKKAVKMAKEAIETICELTEDMEEEYGERSYERQGGSYMRGGSYRNNDWDGINERRGRSY